MVTAYSGAELKGARYRVQNTGRKITGRWRHAGRLVQFWPNIMQRQMKMDLVTLLSLKLTANLVGSDEHGNRYYEERKARAGKPPRRYVRYNGVAEGVQGAGGLAWLAASHRGYSTTCRWLSQT
jgi:hypothetical protein